MEKTNDSIRERLLQPLPKPEDFEQYRQQVASALERNDRRFRMETWVTAALWIYAIAFFMVLTFMGPKRLDTAAGHYCMFFAFLLLMCGAIELLKHFINRTRVDLLKEVKQLQLQVLELQASLQKTGRTE